jgi:hypothetical protein
VEDGTKQKKEKQAGDTERYYASDTTIQMRVCVYIITAIAMSQNASHKPMH